MNYEYFKNGFICVVDINQLFVYRIKIDLNCFSWSVIFFEILEESYLKFVWRDIMGFKLSLG